jgi:hypothetical protein
MKLFTRLFLILGITLAGWSSVAWEIRDGVRLMVEHKLFRTILVLNHYRSFSKRTGTSFPDAFAWDLGALISYL